jgi:hypothetical protein
MSEAKNQAQLLSEGFLDTLDRNKVDFEDAAGIPVTARLLVLAAADFVKRVQKNLNDMGKVSTGTLATDIIAGEVQAGGGIVSITVGYPAESAAANYYDFVNKGVKGVQSGEPADSPYAFKESKNKFDKYAPPPVMVSAILGWMEQNNIRARAETQTENLSPLQSKRKSLREATGGDPQRSLAYAIARSIKRRGLPYTGFFDEARAYAFGDKFIADISKAVGADVRLAIRQAKREGLG